MCVSLWVCFTVSQWAARGTQSPCNDEVRTGSCCYQRGKQRWINYACSRDCAHYDSGKLSVTFCGPRGGYGCTEKAPLTSCSREGHSCIWTKRCTKSSISLALEVSVCIPPRLQCRQFTFCRTQPILARKKRPAKHCWICLIQCRSHVLKCHLPPQQDRKAEFQERNKISCVFYPYYVHLCHFRRVFCWHLQWCFLTDCTSLLCCLCISQWERSPHTHTHTQKSRAYHMTPTTTKHWSLYVARVHTRSRSGSHACVKLLKTHYRYRHTDVVTAAKCIHRPGKHSERGVMGEMRKIMWRETEWQLSLTKKQAHKPTAFSLSHHQRHTDTHVLTHSTHTHTHKAQHTLAFPLLPRGHKQASGVYSYSQISSASSPGGI